MRHPLMQEYPSGLDHLKKDKFDPVLDNSHNPGTLQCLIFPTKKWIHESDNSSFELKVELLSVVTVPEKDDSFQEGLEGTFDHLSWRAILERRHEIRAHPADCTSSEMVLNLQLQDTWRPLVTFQD